MAGDLMLHCGGRLVTKDTLDLIPMPPETDSYKPVSHYGLVQKVLTVTQDLLKEFHLVREQYAINKEGKQFFGVLNFAGENPDIGLAVAMRNSFDRSMTVGFAIGGSVFVCDNLAINGDISVMRKHTANVWNDLESLIVTTLYNNKHKYFQIVEDSQCMIQRGLSNEEAWQIMGLLYGMEIIGPRQLTDVNALWMKPDREAFEPRNLWSFYNNCTQALKSTPPIQCLNRHIALHDAIMKWNQPEVAFAAVNQIHPYIPIPGVFHGPEPDRYEVIDLAVNE